MAEFDTNPLEYLKEILESRSVLKQEVWRQSKEVFARMKDTCIKLADELEEKIDHEDVEVKFSEVSEYEFQMKFGSDVLVFILHTNVVTFGDENHLMKLERTLADPRSKYFGQIMIYNFMADTLLYERKGDAGYLISRLLVNVNNEFHVEGVRKLQYLFPEGGTAATQQNISHLLKRAMAVTIETDLIGDDFGKIKQISFGEKLARNQEIGFNSKIGFQMEYSGDVN